MQLRLKLLKNRDWSVRRGLEGDCMQGTVRAGRSHHLKDYGFFRLYFASSRLTCTIHN
jgi:hypothetical protein